MKNLRMNRYLTQSAAIILLSMFSLPGCNQSNPGNWDEATVEIKLKDKMNLESLDLSPTEDGYSGSGTDAEGESFELKVTQDATAKELKYVAEGNRGAIEEGAIAFD